METNIYNLYENMTDSFTAYRDIEFHLRKQAMEVIKSAFETLIEKGLCKHFPEDYDEEHYTHGVKDFSTDDRIFSDLSGVAFYPGNEEYNASVGFFYDGEDMEDNPSHYDSDAPTEVLFDLASCLYHEVESL